MSKMLCVACALLLCGEMLAQNSIVLISDSTAVNYRGKKNAITGTASWAPMSGWGEYLADDIRKDVTLHNRSFGGFSSKTYCLHVLPEAKTFFKKGGWLLLSFGSNDVRPGPGEDRTTKPESTFQEYMNRIATEAKKAGMNVVVISPLPYYEISKGTFAPTALAPYAQACRTLAQKNGYYFIDAYSLLCASFKKISETEIRSHYMFLKPGESPNWPNGASDMLHYNQKGAKLVWKTIRSEIDKHIPELSQLLKSNNATK